MIRGVMFDLYDTLIYINPDIQKKYKGKFARAVGATPEEIAAVWRTYLDRRFSGEIATLKEMIEIVLRDMGKNPADFDIERLEDLEMRALTEAAFSYPGVDSMIQWLRDNDFRLALVSNASTMTRRVMADLPWLQHFHHVVLSCEVNMVKPHPEIYLATLKMLELQPYECLFVGDGGSRELDGARNVGMPTVKVIQDRQDPTYERSQESDFRINSVTELPWLIRLFNDRVSGRDNWIF